MATPQQNRYMIDVMGADAAAFEGAGEAAAARPAVPHRADPAPASAYTAEDQGARAHLTTVQQAAIVNPAFQPTRTQTHCNQAVLAETSAMGGDTRPLVDRQGHALHAAAMGANLARAGSGYHEIDAVEAQRLADHGVTVLLTGPDHVAEVAPDDIPGQTAPGHGPVIGNVGRTNAVERLSFVLTPADQVKVRYFVQDAPAVPPAR